MGKFQRSSDLGYSRKTPPGYIASQVHLVPLASKKEAQHLVGFLDFRYKLLNRNIAPTNF